MIENTKNAMVILVIGGILSILITGVGTLNQPDIKEEFPSEYKFIKANTENALIQIQIESIQELIEHAQALNITTIYESGPNYVIIDRYNDTSYTYYQMPLWYGLPYFPYMTLGFVPLAIAAFVIFFYSDTKEAKQ